MTASTSKIHLSQLQWNETLIFPKISPVEGVADFIYTKERTRRLPNIRAIAEHFGMQIQHMGVTRWADERHLRRMEEVLQKKQLTIDSVRPYLDLQWKKLYRLDLRLRSDFVKMDQFVKLNKEKKERWLKKLQFFREMGKNYDDAFRDLKGKYKYLSRVKEEMERQIHKMTIYENYLQRVVETSDGRYGSPEDILNAYEMNMIIKEQIIDRDESSLNAILDFRNCTDRLLSDQAANYRMFRNKLADLVERQEKAAQNCARWSTTITRIISITNAFKTDYFTAYYSIWKLYEYLALRKGVEVLLDRSDVEQQLSFIKRALGTWDPILGSEMSLSTFV